MAVDKSPRRLLMGLLLVSAVLSVLFALRVPYGAQFGLNPDETAHHDYIRLLVENHGLVKFVPPATGTTLAEGAPEPWETHQPPLYYLLCAPVYALSGGSIVTVRLVAALIQLVTIALAFRAARDLIPSRPELALGVAAFVAFLPTQAQLAGAINNDGLTTLICLTVFWRLGLLVKSGQEVRGAAILGALLGAGILTKLTIFQLFPVVMVAYAVAAGAKQLSWKQAATRCGIALGVALLIASPWLIRNTLLYGDPLNLRIFPLTAGPAPATPETMARYGLVGAAYWRIVALRSFATFWFILPPNAIQPDLPRFCLVVLIALGGIIGALREPEREGVANGERRVVLLGMAAVVLLIPFFVRFNLQFFQAQGRYFLPVLLPVALVCLVGWGSVVGAGKRAVAALVFVDAIMLALCLFQIAGF